MTIRQELEAFCVNSGMFDRQAKEVVDRMVASRAYPQLGGVPAGLVSSGVCLISPGWVCPQSGLLFVRPALLRHTERRGRTADKETTWRIA